MKYRIIKKLYYRDVFGYYPQYYHKSMFNFLSGWKYFKEPVFTDVGSDYDEVSLPSLEKAEEWLEEEKLIGKQFIVKEYE